MFKWVTLVIAASRLAASQVATSNNFETTFPVGNALALSASPSTAQTFTGITVDTYESTNPPGNAIDGNQSTFWHSEYVSGVLAFETFLRSNLLKDTG
jgi:hypothetical protein